MEREAITLHRSDQPRSRAFLWPVLVSAVVLLGSGWGYRSLAVYYGQKAGSVPFPSGTLAALPLRIDHWLGHEVPFAPEVVEATSVDDYINRVYVKDLTGDSVSLYIASGVHYRDLAPHRAEVCYVGSGWTLQSANQRDIELKNSEALSCQVHNFSRGGLSSEKLTVLSYYILDGAFSRDVSALRRIAWQGKTNVRYVAQVQIAAAGFRSTQSTADMLAEFAGATRDPIVDLLQAAVEKFDDSTARDPVPQGAP